MLKVMQEKMMGTMGAMDPETIMKAWMPGGAFWGGMGEPPMVSVAPALVNALAAATGKRVRALPLVKAGYSLATSA